MPSIHFTDTVPGLTFVTIERIDDSLPNGQGMFNVYVYNKTKIRQAHSVMLRSNLPVLFTCDGKNLNANSTMEVQTRVLDLGPGDRKKLACSWHDVDGTDRVIVITATFKTTTSEPCRFL